MPHMFVRLFRSAGANGHVFLLKNGRTIDKGLAYSGFVGPMSTVAVVPTTPQILDFAVDARTGDKQDIVVSGNVKVTLEPAQAVKSFDFTVNAANGSYRAAWQKTLHEIVLARVLAPIRTKARTLDVEAATQSHTEFETALRAGLGSPAEDTLVRKGIVIESCSIAKVEADDDEVAAAIGAQERQMMLTAADRALHERRLKAAGNDRAVKTYESETAKTLEQERAKLIDAQSANKQKEAEAEAAAAARRLEPFADVPAGTLLGASLMKMAESGRVGNLSIVPEMLAALNQK